MRGGARFLEEIKPGGHLSDVIGKTVKRRAKVREYVGLLPSSQEGAPSGLSKPGGSVPLDMTAKD